MTTIRVEVTDHVPQVTAQVLRAAEQAVGDAAEHLLTEANKTVPLEEGALQRSGTVTHEGLRAVVSYDTPYAVVQHERTDYRHDPGRRAKWLQLTFQEQAGRVGKFIAQRIRGVAG